MIPKDYPYEINIGDEVILTHAYQLEANYLYYQAHRSPNANPLNTSDDLDKVRRMIASSLPAVMRIEDITIDEPTRIVIRKVDGTRMRIPVVLVLPNRQKADESGYRTDMFGFKTNDEHWKSGRWLI